MKNFLTRAMLALAILFTGIAPPVAPALATVEHASASAQVTSGMISRPAAIEQASAGAKFGSGLSAKTARRDHVRAPHFLYTVTDVARDGHVRWSQQFHNLITTEGKNDLLDKYFKGSAYTAAWYLGLKGTGSAAAADTLASHSGWSEVTPYSGNRPAITFGTSSSGSNTATAVSYTINATATVAGVFVSSVNTGTSGKLYSAGDFAASRSVLSGDTLNVTLTVSYT